MVYKKKTIIVHNHSLSMLKSRLKGQEAKV